jgi:hypothetical protein
LLWEPLQIGGNNSFFFFTIPFWRWIFIQKKIVKRQFFSSLFSRFPVYVCVTKQPKIPFRLVRLLYNAPASFVNRNVSA